MIQIYPATTNDVSRIANLLSRKFKTLNASVAYDIYFSDEQRMAKHVSQIISDNDEFFSYGIIKKGDAKVGFINLMHNIKHQSYDILILAFEDDSLLDESDFPTIVEYVKKRAAQYKAKIIQFDGVALDQRLVKLLHSYGIKTYATKDFIPA